MKGTELGLKAWERHENMGRKGKGTGLLGGLVGFTYDECLMHREKSNSRMRTPGQERDKAASPANAAQEHGFCLKDIRNASAWLDLTSQHEYDKSWPPGVTSTGRVLLL